MDDPRPDLKYDSKEWAMLLTILDKHCDDKKFVGVMHGFRCGGLRLDRKAGGYVLRPDLGPSNKWQTKEEYIKDRDEWLMPYKDSIVDILAALTKEMSA